MFKFRSNSVLASIVIVAIQLSSNAVSGSIFAGEEAVEEVSRGDCLCFTASDLLQFNEYTTDFETSCRESHSTGSGLGIFKYYNDQDFNEDGQPLHDEFGYSVNLNSEMPVCVLGNHDTQESSITLGTLEEGEDCAQLIRDRCTEIGHLAEF
jgi:hypothetical protein